MRISSFIIGLLLFGCIVQACETQQPKKYDRLLVTTYAELSLLYEKEKLGAKISDSLYQTQVANFFAKKKITETDFRRQSEQLMNDDKTWKLFLADVSRAVDSLKAINNY